MAVAVPALAVSGQPSVVRGEVSIYGPDGELLARAPNTFVNAGYSALAQIVATAVGAPSPPTYLALGDSTATVLATDTALGNELARFPITAYDTSGAQTAILKAVIPRGAMLLFLTNGLQDVTEVGLFDSGPGLGGTMYARSSFLWEYSANDRVLVTWSLSFV